MSANGRLQPAELTLVQPGIYLANSAAAVYLGLKTAGMPGGIATPIGGYRDYPTQAALKANPGAYNSSLPSSAIASAGNSTHGLGMRVDLVGGAAAWAIRWGGRAIFQRDPAGDPNCFTIDPSQWTPPAVAAPANQRTTKPAIANLRAAHVAGTTAIVGKLAASTAYQVNYWLHGTPPPGSDNDIWFHVGNGFAWSGVFTDATTAGITELEDAVVAPPVYVAPPVVDPPTVPAAPIIVGAETGETSPAAGNPPAQPSGFVAFIQAIIAAILGTSK